MTRKERAERTLGNTQEVYLPTDPDNPWVGVMVQSERWNDIRAATYTAWDALEKIRESVTCKEGCRCGVCYALRWYDGHQ